MWSLLPLMDGPTFSTLSINGAANVATLSEGSDTTGCRKVLATSGQKLSMESTAIIGPRRGTHSITTTAQ